MSDTKGEIVVASPVVDGQQELDPGNAWLGVSSFNVERVTLIDDGAKLYSYYTASQPSIYAGRNPRLKLRRVLDNVLAAGAEGVDTSAFRYIQDGFNNIDYRVERSELPEEDKKGMAEMSEKVRDYIDVRRREYVAGKIAELGALVRTEKPSFWLRTGSALATSEVQHLEALEAEDENGGYQLRVPKTGRIYSRLFQLVDLELHYGENEEPLPLPILADKLGNKGIYTGQVALYTQEAVPAQIEPVK